MDHSVTPPKMKFMTTIEFFQTKFICFGKKKQKIIYLSYKSKDILDWLLDLGPE